MNQVKLDSLEDQFELFFNYVTRKIQPTAGQRKTCHAMFFIGAGSALSLQAKALELNQADFEVYMVKIAEECNKFVREYSSHFGLRA